MDICLVNGETENAIFDAFFFFLLVQIATHISQHIKQTY